MERFPKGKVFFNIYIWVIFCAIHQSLAADSCVFLNVLSDFQVPTCRLFPTPTTLGALGVEYLLSITRQLFLAALASKGNTILVLPAKYALYQLGLIIAIGLQKRQEVSFHIKKKTKKSL